MKTLIVLSILLISLKCLFAQEIRDSFANGKPELRWTAYPHFNLDNVEAIYDRMAPDGDNGIGLLRNKNVGGFAALSYVAGLELENFYLEALVFCPVTFGDRGPLTGMAFLIDPMENRFFRFICDFKSIKPSLNIAYVGRDTNQFPVYLKIWTTSDIKEELPQKAGWHIFAVEVKNGVLKAYFNKKELPGTVRVDRIKRGFVGIYTNFVGGLGEAETKFDSFIIKPLNIKDKQ